MSEWTDIGELLIKARESKDLELMDVAHTTRIPVATLSALEQNDYSYFPSPAYTRSFLAQYSEYLDVDAHEWIEAFETGDILSNITAQGYLQPHHDHIGDRDHNPMPVRHRSRATSNHDESSAKDSRESNILQTFTVFFVTALLIGGGIYAYKKYEPMLTDSPSEQTNGTPSEGGDPATSTTSQAQARSADINSKPEASPPLDANNNDPAAATDPDTIEKPSSPETPVLIKPNRSGPPPKALIVDENEE